MPIPTYTLGYPPDGSSLGQTKAVIRNNLDGTFQTLAVDHINNNGQPGSNPAGYHNVIHVVPQGSNPGAVTGYGQIFSKTINSVTTDQALFWETGTGLIAQLTMNVNPSTAARGYTFLPGGILLQWGVDSMNTSGTPTTKNFPLAFPNNCLSISLTPKNTSSSPSANPIFISSFTATQFTITNSSGSNNTFYWIAIGY